MSMSRKRSLKREDIGVGVVTITETDIITRASAATDTELEPEQLDIDALNLDPTMPMMRRQVRIAAARAEWLQKQLTRREANIMQRLADVGIAL